MSKKILAMFLAVLMVVSMLPASVLAAENDCPLAGQAHNLDNCADYTEKKVVAATCAKGGYTLYECDLCGTTFMGNHTAKLAHEESSIKEAAKEPTYTEPGHVTLYHCDLCDEDWFKGDKYEIDIYDENTEFDCDEGGKCAMKHEGIACSTTGMVSTCVKCGFKVVSREAHEIDYEDGVEIVKEPTATANGEATALCTVCGEKVTLVIYPNHDHLTEDEVIDDSYTLVEVPVDYDCVTGGTIAHLKCVICGKLFLEEEGVRVEKTLADLKGEPVESGKHTVGLLKAESEDGEVESKEVTCTVDGVKIYDCAVCNKEIIEVVPAGHDWEETEIIAMTCGQNGITVRECERCGFTDTVTEIAPQHSTLAEYQAAFAAIGKAIDVEDLEELEYHANCYEVVDGEITGFLKPVANSAVCGDRNGGTFSWNCLNCGEVRTAASPKLEHNLVEYTAPATCAAVSYTFKYCTNANCGLTATGIVKDADDNEYSAVVKTQIEVIEAVLDEDEVEVIGYAKVMKDIVIATPKVSGKITAFGTAVDAESHRFATVTEVEPTCTTAGNFFKKCADCGFEVKSTPAATGHTPITKMDHATKAPVVVAPTCETKGSITYYCKDCDAVAKTEQIAKVTDLQYTDYEEAFAAHAEKLVEASEQIGTCTQYGYVKYNCTGCNHAVIVSDGLTGNGHSDSMTFTSEEAETISVPASINGGYIVIVNAVKADGTAATGKLPVAITINGETIENFGEEVQILDATAFEIVLTELFFALEDEDHPENNYEFASYTITVNFFTKQYPTCTVDGKVVAHKCINPWCDTNLNNDTVETYQFAEKKINKLGHNYVTVKPAVSGVCGEIETRALIACSRCGDIKDEKINNVTVADYYDGRIETEVLRGWDIDEAICANETPLYDLYFCLECETVHVRNYKPVVPHTWNEGVETTEPTCSTTGVMTYTCTECGKTRTETIAADKHKNSDGDFFTDHCNDTEDNRHCVICCSRPNKTDCATKKTNGVYDCAGMIGKNHSDTLEAIEDRGELSEFWNAPTCTAAGFYMVICEYCGEADVIVPEKLDGSDEENKPAGHVVPNYKTENDFTTEADWILYQEKYTDVLGKAYLSYVAPTVQAEGTEKFECATCAGIIERKIDRLENLLFSLEASNADAPACDKFATFSLVALTVKASGIDAALAGFNMTIEIDGAALFVGYKWAENTPFLGAVTEPSVAYANREINIVGRVIGSPEITVEDEALVTLYFRVIDDVTFSFENDEVYAVNAVEEIDSSVQGAEIEVIALGDVNGDDESFGDAILDDLQAAINIFMGVEGSETYNVAADINRNGEIDLQDLQLMCKISAGNMDEFDIWFLNTYEGEVELIAELAGLCLECHGFMGNHSINCSKYVNRT